jgi:hypothetical protein
MKTGVAVSLAAMLDIFGWRCMRIVKLICVYTKFLLVDFQDRKEVY